MNARRCIRIRDDQAVEIPYKCARSVFSEIFGSRRTEICFGRSAGLWLWLWIAKSAANRGSKKIFRRFDFGMNFMGSSGNSSSTVLHSCTATLTQRNTATYLLNDWQGWVTVITCFLAMGVRILRGNS